MITFACPSSICPHSLGSHFFLSRYNTEFILHAIMTVSDGKTMRYIYISLYTWVECCSDSHMSGVMTSIDAGRGHLAGNGVAHVFLVQPVVHGGQVGE